MKIQCSWNDKMRFTAQEGGHSVEMDTKPPLGADSALTPKHLVLAGLCGCTAMDVVALLRKFKQPVESFQIEADAEMTDGGHPVVFRNVKLIYRLTGQLDKDKALEAVALSQSKYCGVSAMISKAAPVSYTVELNDTCIGAGRAEFQ